MTASPLGPCPVCDDVLVAEVTAPAHLVGFAGCTRTGCGYIATVEHWNLLRRKMTAEEARTVLGAVVDAALANDGMGNKFEVAWESGIAAITGENT